MTGFEEDKAKKLNRILGLRILNFLGVIAWKEGKYNDANQYLRLLHPISWIWMIAFALLGILAQGIPETIRDFKEAWRNAIVWW